MAEEKAAHSRRPPVDAADVGADRQRRYWNVTVYFTSREVANLSVTRTSDPDWATDVVTPAFGPRKASTLVW